MSKHLPKGMWSRSAELLGLAAKIGAKEIQKRVEGRIGESALGSQLKFQVEQATAVVQSLGRLKGAAMKAGQLLSIEAGDFLPPEVLSVLGQLQDSAPPMPWSVVQQQLQQQLGSEKLQRFESIEETPFASASIGQVHRAVLDKATVAIKVQYPGVADSIESDLILLKGVAKSLLAVSSKSIPLDDLFDELRAVLKREVNYSSELEFMNRYRSILNGHPSYVVPTPVAEMSSAQVFTMSFEPGLRVQDWIASAPKREEREHFGRSILDLYTLEFFENGLVQTDPNFGNFLVRPKERQIVLLDFGATREYSLEFRNQYRELLRRIRSGKKRDIVDQCVAMELVSDRESQDCYDSFVLMLKRSTDPFDPELQPFQFSNKDYTQQVREASLDFTRKIKHSAPPHQLIFLHRKLGGIFNLLKSLDVRIDLVPYWEQLVGTSPTTQTAT